MKKTLLALAAVANFSFAGDLTASCEEYFKEVDKFVELTKDNPQMASMKSTYEMQKAEFKKLPKDTQEGACKPALEQIKQVIATIPQK